MSRKQTTQKNHNNSNKALQQKNSGNSGNKKSRKIFKNIMLTLFVIMLASVICIIGGISYFQHFLTTPADSTMPLNESESQQVPEPKQTSKSRQTLNSKHSATDKKNVLFTIKSGESLQQIAQRLEEAGIIKNRYLFRLLAMLRGVATKIQAGEYLLSGSNSPETILNRMVTGKVKLHKLTIPEGLTVKEIAALVEQTGFGTSTSFIHLASDKHFISAAGIIANPNINVSGSNIANINIPNTNISNTNISNTNISNTNIPDPLEGYLFPDTYFFPAHVSQKEIIISMIKRFNQVFTPKWRERCKILGFSSHEIVTLASIIEKETGAAHERPLIASVFHNRLAKKMRLQSDPTVIYGIPDFNGNITRKDLKRVTPYNTYTINGLPAGPIANPGKLSLQAALFPEQADFIYFVSKNDSTHHFSKTLKEHNRAVRKYQLGK